MDKYLNLPIYDEYIELLKSKKNALIYECETCKYYTLNGNNYKRHILNAKHLNGGQQLPREYTKSDKPRKERKKQEKKEKKEENYNCNNCNYNTKNKSVYNRHTKSKRHILMCKIEEKEEIEEIKHIQNTIIN